MSVHQDGCIVLAHHKKTAMKKLTLSIVLAIIIPAALLSQSCLPEGITFTTQAEIDSFQIIYPDCTEIEGDVEINGNYITNLDGLNVLTAFWGSLWIYFNDDLTSLSGLDNVTSVGGFLYVGFNPVLTSLLALSNVTSVGENLSIEDNYVLTSLTGLENVTYIGGDLEIVNNPVLTSLSAMNNITSIGGGLLIENNDALTILSGLDNVTSIGEFLWIVDNATLTSLSALFNVTSISEYIWIIGNVALSGLSGLDNIDAASIAGLYIYNNTALSTCGVQSICDYLASPSGEITINSNAPGCNSREEVEEACAVSVNEVSIINNLFIHPNPCYNTITIEYELKQPEIVTIAIYNHLGEKAKAIKEREIVGQQIIELNCRELPAGIYFCVLKTNPPRSGQIAKMIKL